MGSGGISSTLLTIGSTLFGLAVFAGIGAAVILGIIPSYLTTRDLTPAGEKYCVSNLVLNISFNTSSPYGNFNRSTANTSYPLSEACYRILQNSKSDTLLTACLISSCTFDQLISVNNTITTTNISCYAVIYYEARCPAPAASSGINSTVDSSGNGACRKQRMQNINTALGSTTVSQFTNVVSLIFDNVVVPIQSIFTYPFSYYSQSGAYYCGLVSQTDITSAVNAQATG